MPTKIRLQRKGKKGQPFYHLVVADGRAPRDGKFIERIGTYNPMTHPATIEINFDRALYWVQVGAQPTDTVRSILSLKGVLLKHHLLKGLNKGALTEEQVEERFNVWVAEKEEKISRISKDKDATERDRMKNQLEEEKKINEAKAAELAKKRAKERLAVDAGKAVEIAEAAEATDNAEAAEATDNAEVTETTEAVENVQATESATAGEATAEADIKAEAPADNTEA